MTIGTSPKNKRSKLIIKLVLLVGTAVSLFFVPWPILWTWIRPMPDTLQEQVNQALDHGFEGIIVYVDEAGTPPAFYTAGWHDRDRKIPAYPKALFKIASINKLYVAVAVTKLVNAGKLSLDSTLGHYLPAMVGKIDNATEITLRMMVKHRSGIPNFTDTPNYWTNQPANAEEALARVYGLPAKFEPDEDYQYSNTNYMLLANIMNKVLGEDHFNFLRESVLLPFELNHTYGSLDGVNMDSVMSGYHIGYAHDLKMDDHGMVATAMDVGIFLRALNEGTLFEAGEKEIYDSIYVYDHTGLVPGYQSIARYHRDMDAVVIQFTNTTDSKGYNWNISEIVYNRLIKILRKQES